MILIVSSLMNLWSVAPSVSCAGFQARRHTTRLPNEILQQGIFILDIRRELLLPLFLQSHGDDGIDEVADDTHPSVHLILPELDEWPEGTIMKPPCYGLLSPAECPREQIRRM